MELQASAAVGPEAGPAAGSSFAVGLAAGLAAGLECLGSWSMCCVGSGTEGSV